MYVKYIEVITDKIGIYIGMENGRMNDARWKGWKGDMVMKIT